MSDGVPGSPLPQKGSGAQSRWLRPGCLQTHLAATSRGGVRRAALAAARATSQAGNTQLPASTPTPSCLHIDISIQGSCQPSIIKHAQRGPLPPPPPFHPPPPQASPFSTSSSRKPCRQNLSVSRLPASGTQGPGNAPQVCKQVLVLRRLPSCLPPELGAALPGHQELVPWPEGSDITFSWASSVC